MSSAKRVLVAGLFHETHTFLEETTGLSDFSMRLGADLLAVAGDGSPLAGALETGQAAGWEIVPSVDLRATPSGTVADEVFETFWEHFSRTYSTARETGLDGIYLVLHGAMVCQACRDVEGEILQRIRDLPGGDVPICGVYDLHGNMSRRSIELADGFVAYRCNPHTDSHRAAVDAANLLDRILTTGRRPVSVWEQVPVMWPPTGTGTAVDPMQSLEAMARDIEASDDDIAAVNVFAGFSFADTVDTGVSFSAVTFGDAEATRGKLRTLCDWAVAHREAGNVVAASLEESLPQIEEHVAAGRTPVVVAEPADNIGGGAPGDATTLLRAFIDRGIVRSAVVIDDAAAIAQLWDIPAGESLDLEIGGKGSRLTEGPVAVTARVISKSDGRFDLEDRNSHLASMAGTRIEMGRCVTAQCGPVTVLLTSRKTPPFDLGQLRSQGIEPEQCSVIGVKAAVAHRRAYDGIAGASLTVETPGPCGSDLKAFGFQNVRRPVYPLDG